MFKRTLTATAIAALMMTPALAQSSKTDMSKDHMDKPGMSQPMQKDKTPTNSTMQAPTDAQAFITQQANDDWRTTKLVGTSVTGQNDESIGDINDVLIGSNGEVKAVVVGVGGFLGVGEKNVAIPFNALTVTRKANSESIAKIRVSYTKDQLKQAPGFKYYTASKDNTPNTASEDTNTKMAPKSTTTTR